MLAVMMDILPHYLGTAKTLSQYRHELKGKVIFIFQPAEETPPGGAKYMIEDGVLKMESIMRSVPI